MQSLLIQKDALEAALCKESFFDFFLAMWSVIIHEDLVPNWHIELLCNELQRVGTRIINREPKEYDLIINISPGTTKSTICSIMFPAWLWAVDPTMRVIAGSYAYDLSNDLSEKFYNVVTSDKYQRLFPHVKIKKEAMEHIKNTQMGERIATSTGGRITGMHAHCIIIDDPLNPKEAVSDAFLLTANNWFDHTLYSRMVSKSLTPIILVMQRLHQNDPTAHQLEQALLPGALPVRHINLPAEITPDVRPRSLRKFYDKDGIFDPVRLPRPILEQIKTKGDYQYAGQYLQNPIPPGGGMFKTDLIEISNAAPPMIRMVRYWDKAGTGGKGCYTVGALFGIDRDKKRIWIMDIVRGQWEASEREKIIKQTAQRDGRGVIVAVEQEGGSGGKESAQSTVRNLLGYRIMVDTPKGDKIMRADPFAIQVNSGNVRMVRGSWNGEYLNELRFFPYSKYKDQVDASSGAIAMLSLKRTVGAL